MAEFEGSHSDPTFIRPVSVSPQEDGSVHLGIEVAATNFESAERAAKELSTEVGGSEYVLFDKKEGHEVENKSGRSVAFSRSSWKAPWVPSGDIERAKKRAAREVAINEGLQQQPPQRPGNN
jgi:hypothetical protein